MGTKGGPPARKAPGTAVGNQNGQRAVLTETGEGFPIPEECTQPEAVQAWEDYWNDPVSSVVTVVDRTVLIRWICMVNRYWTLIREADQDPLINTSANGWLAHPLYKITLAMENQIERLEGKLGIGPKNRAALGIQIIGQAQAQQNFERNQPGSSKPDDDDDDPRFG